MNHVGAADRRPVSYEGTSNGEKLHTVWNGELQRAACASILTAMPKLRKLSLKYTDKYCHQTQRISLVYRIPPFHQSQSIVSCWRYLTWCGCKLRARRALFVTCEPFALTCGPDWGCISVSSFPFTSFHAGLSWLDPTEESFGGEWVYRSFLMRLCLRDVFTSACDFDYLGIEPFFGSPAGTEDFVKAGQASEVRMM